MWLFPEEFFVEVIETPWGINACSGSIKYDRDWLGKKESTYISDEIYTWAEMLVVTRPSFKLIITIII